MPTFTAKPGYLSREELIERYERESGIEAENLRFYRVLAAYKMAALGEMFFRRHLEGNAADSLYPKMRDGVPRLAKRTLEMAKGSGDVSLRTLLSRWRRCRPPRRRLRVRRVVLATRLS
ncbi:hypothetical protein [Natronoarchaeum sp. GCM10025703]|uniref:hypothetical protein n=1 Tax=Natronoarchaeum sp. GCM10025703 TaxID=3252685 RepID=UPI00366C285E